MKQKLIDFCGFMLFILMFIIALPVICAYGAIKTPIRYFRYVSAKVHDRKPNKYYF